MAVRAYFYGGPMDGQWKAMQEPMKEIRVARREPVDVMSGPNSTPAIASIVQGTYIQEESIFVDDGRVIRVHYGWAGWDDDLQEVQESKGQGIE